MEIKLSIITICLNNLEGLERTINSVGEQTFNEYEFLIVDGGSTDGSVECIQAYSNEIDWWVSEKDSGIYNAMNKGIKKAVGEYCLFLNSGDMLATRDTLLEALSPNYNEDIIYGDLIRKKGNKKYRITKYPDELSVYHFYAPVPSLHHQASFIKRELFRKYGLYREDLKLISDWEFFLKAIVVNGCSTRHIKKTITIFDSFGISSGGQNSEEHLKEEILVSYFPDIQLNKLDELYAQNRSITSKLKGYLEKKYRIYSILRYMYLPFIRTKEYLNYKKAGGE